MAPEDRLPRDTFDRLCSEMMLFHNIPLWFVSKSFLGEPRWAVKSPTISRGPSELGDYMFCRFEVGVNLLRVLCTRHVDANQGEAML